MDWSASKSFAGSSLATKSSNGDVDMDSTSASKHADKNALTSGADDTQKSFQGSFEVGIEYQKFAQALGRLLRQNSGSNRSLDLTTLLPEFGTLCSTRALQYEQRAVSDVGYLAYGALDEQRAWLSESNTWLLLTTLSNAFDYRKPPPSKPADALAWSDQDLVNHLESTDSDFIHHSAIKLWLEVIAPPFTPHIATKKLATQAPKPAFGFNSFAQSNTPSAAGVTFQDPDATTRDGSKRSAQNETIEHDLLQTVWEYIRRGQVQAAKDACVKGGDPWRADSIDGGQLYSIPTAFDGDNYDRTDDRVGNKSRGLWKGTCFALAEDKAADPYERAIYGALSGDINSVLPVCSTWEDHAWARYNALVESMVEARLAQFHRGGAISALPLPKTSLTGAKDVFDSLANSGATDLKDATKDLFRRIQMSIILGQTGQLLKDFAKEAEESSRAGAPFRPHILRFMAHFVLLLRSREPNLPRAEGDYFIKQYTDHLIAKKLYALAPLYGSFLPSNLQVRSISSYLKNIDGSKHDRQEQIQTIHKYRLDVRSILMATVDGLLNDSRADLERSFPVVEGLRNSINDPIDQKEKTQISALEWLSFDPAYFEECLHRSNNLTRRYLAQGRLNVAFALYNTLPQDIAQQELGEGSPAYLAVAHEYIYYRDFFAARLLFEEWKEKLASKPQEARRMDFVAWESELKEKAKKAATEIEALLRSRWLSDCSFAGDEARNIELNQLRQIYVSELVMNLHRVYFESRKVIPEYLEKSVEMANLVASESSAVPLYKEMQESHRLQEFLSQVRLSSLELIKEQRSAFAF